MVCEIYDVSVCYVFLIDVVWEMVIFVLIGDIVCYNDFVFWNFIIGDCWVFIDWDVVVLSMCFWDFVYVVQVFVLFDDVWFLEVVGWDFVVFVDGYGVDCVLCWVLFCVMEEWMVVMLVFLEDVWLVGEELWVLMYVNGYGEYWLRVLCYVCDNCVVWLCLFVD